MGWVYVAPKPHICDLPVLTDTVTVGSIWQCDECSAQYLVCGESRCKYYKPIGMK